MPYHISLEEIKAKNPKGIIFIGGPNSVYGEDSPRCASELFRLGIPILGICDATIYPDVIESGLGNSVVIKSHHNVGGLPDCVGFKEIIEPLGCFLRMRSVLSGK